MGRYHGGEDRSQGGPGTAGGKDDEFEFPAHKLGRAETQEEKEEVSVWDEFSNQLTLLDGSNVRLNWNIESDMNVN
jgi:hypothetical protein